MSTWAASFAELTEETLGNVTWIGAENFLAGMAIFSGLDVAQRQNRKLVALQFHKRRNQGRCMKISVKACMSIQPPPVGPTLRLKSLPDP